MMNGAGHVKLKVSFVLQMIDSFTEKTVSDANVQVSAKDVKLPIRKRDGYYVFINCPMKQLEIRVSSPLFLEEHFFVDTSKLPNDNPVVKVRLKPNRRYPLLNHALRLEGKAKAGGLVEVVLYKNSDFLRIISDYDNKTNGNLLCVYNPKQKDIENAKFFIINEEEQKKEIFFIDYFDCEKNAYQLAEPLKKSYSKIGTRIYPVYGTVTDSYGNYYLPIKIKSSEAIESICFIDGKEQMCTLQMDRSNSINLI